MSDLVTPFGGNVMANRRHISIDNITKVIYIQVMYTIRGDLVQKEYHDIKNGEWWRYVPKDLLQSFRKAVNEGFDVRPIVITGQCNEEYYITQIVDMGEKILIES